jgi:hypothetical protein
MVLLAPPTQVGERQYYNDWCGQAAGSSVASDWLSQSVFPPAIQAAVPVNLRIPGGTTGYGLVAALQALGVPAKGPYGLPLTQSLKNLDAGKEIIFLHQCNLGAQPVPVGSSDIAHWRVAYGWDTVVHDMNPWTGLNEATSTLALYASDLKVFILIDGVMPKDRQIVLPGEDMTWDQNLKDGLIDVFRTGTFGKWPESLPVVETYASQIRDDGSNVLEVLQGLKTDFLKGGGILLGDRVTALEARDIATLDVNSLIRAIGQKLAS